jgi:hypothetical protein
MHHPDLMQDQESRQQPKKKKKKKSFKNAASAAALVGGVAGEAGISVRLADCMAIIPPGGLAVWMLLAAAASSSALPSICPEGSPARAQCGAFTSSCLPAAVRSTAPQMNSAAGCGHIARTAQHEHALRATVLTAHGAPVCSKCEAGATIGIARDADGMWMRFLCEACHGLANSSYAAESCGSGGLHALGLAGRCAKCRTKASYGAPLSPPQRCLRHKEARDIARSLGSSCVVDGCKKARLFGSRGGVPLFCAAHRRADDVDVKNKRCQFQDCLRQASYGDASTRCKIACAEHRQPWHVDLKHERRRCAAPEGCGKLGVFKRRLIITPPDPPSHPQPAAEANSRRVTAGHSSEDGVGDSNSGSHHLGSRLAKLRLDQGGARGVEGKAVRSNTQAPDSCPKSRRHTKSAHDSWVFVCASHLNLNVFSASATQEVKILVAGRPSAGRPTACVLRVLDTGEKEERACITACSMRSKQKQSPIQSPSCVPHA